MIRMQITWSQSLISAYMLHRKKTSTILLNGLSIVHFMAIVQYRSKRKPSGGRYHNSFKKKLRFLSRLPTLTKLDKTKKRSLRTTSGSRKTLLLTADIANVFDPKTKKHFKAKIETITQNPANLNYVRRNIMTKGAVIKTEKGLARITSRPGQEGTINAILLHEK